MGLTTRQIADIYKGLWATPTVTAQTIVRNMLVCSLSPHRRKVYERVYDARGKGITARQIADEWGTEIASQSNALKELYDMDLIIRSESHDADGLFYVYRAALKEERKVGR